MPRETITLNRFNGGICDHQEPRDLKDIEIVEGIDISIDSDGKISRCGLFDNLSTLTNIASSGTTVVVGYGLFTFSADHTSTGGNTPTDYFAIAYSRNSGTSVFKEVVICERDGTKWNSTAGSSWISMTTGSDTTEFHPVFYYIDGALRICDGNLNSTKTTNKWFGFVNQKLWTGSTYSETVTQWIGVDNNLASPTKGLYGILLGVCTAAGDTNTAYISIVSNIGTTLDSGIYFLSDNNNNLFGQITAHVSTAELTTANVASAWASGDQVWIMPPVGTGFNVHVESGNHANGAWTPSTNWTFFQTFLYDNKQESRLHEMTGPNAGLALSSTENYITGNVIVQGPYDRRITGGRIYAQETNKPFDPFYLVLEIDFDKGVHTSDNEVWDDWDSYGATGGPLAGFVSYTLGPETYETLNGIDPSHWGSSTKPLSARYKTVAIANRIAYFGNVLYDGKINSDSIFKSTPNKFDLTTDERELEVAKNDGENIVKLETYADRILEFKERHLYIINTAQDIEFLEDEYDWKGVSKPYHVLKTEYGIIWFNNYGVFLYNGETVLDLFYDFEDRSRRKISLSTFQSFLGTSPSIGYDANTKKCIITQNSAHIDSYRSNLYIFNLENRTWLKSYKNFGDSINATAFTNIVTWFNGNIVSYDAITRDMYYLKEGSTNSTTSLSIKTKDIDFGMPGIKKNVYKVYVTHKGNGAKMIYRKNGDTAVYSFSSHLLPAATSWVTTEFTPSTLSQSKNLYSYQLHISKSSTASGVSSTFAINDINIIARRKGDR